MDPAAWFTALLVSALGQFRRPWLWLLNDRGGERGLGVTHTWLRTLVLLLPGSVTTSLSELLLLWQKQGSESHCVGIWGTVRKVALAHSGGSLRCCGNRCLPRAYYASGAVLVAEDCVRISQNKPRMISALKGA